MESSPCLESVAASQLMSGPTLETPHRGLALGPRGSGWHLPHRGPSTMAALARSAQTSGLMPNTSPGSLPAFLATCAFGALSLLGGWFVVHRGGFYTAQSKYSANATFIAGMPAYFMAMIHLAAAALAFTWARRRYLSPVASSLAAFGLVRVPPLLFFVLGKLSAGALSFEPGSRRSHDRGAERR